MESFREQQAQRAAENAGLSGGSSSGLGGTSSYGIRLPPQLSQLAGGLSYGDATTSRGLGLSAPLPYDTGAPAWNPATMPVDDQTIYHGIVQAADALGMDPGVLATIASYETAGTMDPTKAGPTTEWGQHRGFIQFGEPQAAQYGADFSSPEAALASQLGPEGAVVRYFRDRGWQPGMSTLDAYSIVNTGSPGNYDWTDAGQGGAPGTVADKVGEQFHDHSMAVLRRFGSYGLTTPWQPPAPRYAEGLGAPSPTATGLGLTAAPPRYRYDPAQARIVAL